MEINALLKRDYQRFVIVVHTNFTLIKIYRQNLQSKHLPLIWGMETSPLKMLGRIFGTNLAIQIK